MKGHSFKKVEIWVAANGYTLSFSERIGDFTTKTFFVAKTLEETKKLCEANLTQHKNF